MRGPHDRTSVDDDVLTLALGSLVECEPSHDLRTRVERAIAATGKGADSRALWWNGMAWAAGTLVLLVLAAGVLRPGRVQEPTVTSHTTSPVIASPPNGPGLAAESTAAPIAASPPHLGRQSRSTRSAAPTVGRAAIMPSVPAGWGPTVFLLEEPEPIEESAAIEVASLTMPPLELDSVAIAPLREIQTLP